MVAVSVIMPTYKQAWHIARSVDSLFRQTFTDWELIVIDDASPDGTQAAIEPYLEDGRITYTKLASNQGLGHALNTGIALAKAPLITYLPSDDFMYPNHLHSLVHVLRTRDVDVAYSGVTSNHEWQGWSGLTLAGSGAVGRELEALTGEFVRDKNAPNLTSNNILALVQVAHRNLSKFHGWQDRREEISDYFEAKMWTRWLVQGAIFASTQVVTCEWTSHPDQLHKIITGGFGGQPPVASATAGRGLSGFKNYYGLATNLPVIWTPSRGPQIDETRRYYPSIRETIVGTSESAIPKDHEPPLRILVVGELGFNGDRLAAFTDRGHTLYGLWIPFPEEWDTAHAPPTVPMHHVPQADYVEYIKQVKPQVVYALLNYQAIDLIDALLEQKLDIPVVFHFKESQFFALWSGRFPALRRIIDRCSAFIPINAENQGWFEENIPELRSEKIPFTMDGDMPSRRWAGELSASKLSDKDGEIHTVSVGRAVGIPELSQLAENKIHVHLYGGRIENNSLRVSRKNSRFFHLHSAIEPRDWAQLLSQYDAAWTHVFEPAKSRGESSLWPHYNLPARLGTYAIAGLPWISHATNGTPTATQRLARHHKASIEYQNLADLSKLLYDHTTMAEQANSMAITRNERTFDFHVDRLISLFRHLIK